MTFETAPALIKPLVKAIAERQCPRGETDGKPLMNDDLALLARAFELSVRD